MAFWRHRQVTLPVQNKPSPTSQEQRSKSKTQFTSALISLPIQNFPGALKGPISNCAPAPSPACIISRGWEPGHRSPPRLTGAGAGIPDIPPDRLQGLRAQAGSAGGSGAAAPLPQEDREQRRKEGGRPGARTRPGLPAGRSAGCPQSPWPHATSSRPRDPGPHQL